MKRNHMSKTVWLVAVIAAVLAVLFALTAFAETALPDGSEDGKAAELIAYQVTQSDGETFSLRLITGISSLAYKSCGYAVIVTTTDAEGNETVTALTSEVGYVYSSIYAGNTEYAIRDFSEYDYASLVTVANLNANAADIKIEIRPYVSVEGEVLYCTVGELAYTGGENGNGYPSLSYTSGDGTELPFIPSVRFAATSDVHIQSATGTQVTRLGTIMGQLAEYFADEDNNGGHAGVDALLVAGDVTNDGTEEQVILAKDYFDNLLEGTDTELVITMGNHDWNAYNDYKTYDNTVAVEQFEEYFGEGTATGMVKIGGYYFITLNADDLSPYSNQEFRGWGWGYSDERIEEYEAMIEAAIADTGKDKPIFVVRHIGDVGTVLGTDEYIASRSSTSVSNLYALQSKYPNLVVLSGHSHFPLYDEYSIHQKDFTSLNTGTLGSSSTPRLEKTTVSDHENATLISNKNATAVWLVETDVLGRTRIRRWDGAKDGFIGDTYMLDYYRKDRFIYTEDRYDASDLFFAEDAKVTPYDVFATSASVSFLPVPAESLQARAYEVTLTDALGNVVEQHYICPEYYLENYQASMQYTFSGLTANTEYTATVVAINPHASVEIDHEDAFRSAPLTATFTTAVSDTAAGADLIDIVIYPEIGLVGRKSAQNLSVGMRGTPSFRYDESMGMNVVSLDGTTDSILRFDCTADSISQTLVDGFTLETLVRIDEQPTEDVGLVSSIQSGGYGLWAYTNGNLTFILYDSNKTYKLVLCEYEIGVYYHVVASFDGSTCTVYLNGEAVGTATLDETGLKLAATVTNRNLVVGADTNSGTKIQGPSKCTVGIVRLYSNALSETEATAAYEAAVANRPQYLLNLQIDATAGTAADTAGQGVVQTTLGTPVYAYDKTVGRDVVSVNGNEATALHFKLKDVAERLLDGFTFEALVRVDTAPVAPESGSEKATGLLGGLHGGGFGLFIYSDGTMNFQIYNGTASSDLKKIDVCDYTVGTYYHVMAVQDGEACKVYLNGELVGSAEVPTFSFSATEIYRNIVVGGDAYIATPSKFQNPSECTVGIFRLYDNVFSATEVAEAYGRAVK